MPHCIGDYRDNFAISYLDDLLIFSKTLCELARRISAEGYTVDPRSTEALTSKTKKRQTNLSELTNLLDLIGYFRRPVPNFRQTVKLLYQLLKDNELKRGTNQKIEWRDDHPLILDKDI